MGASRKPFAIRRGMARRTAVDTEDIGPSGRMVPTTTTKMDVGTVLPDGPPCYGIRRDATGRTRAVDGPGRCGHDRTLQRGVLKSQMRL